MDSKRTIIWGLVFAILFTIFPFELCRNINAAYGGTPYLVCRKCGYGDKITSAGCAMCSSTDILKAIWNIIKYIGEFIGIINTVNEYIENNNGKFKCPKCKSTDIYYVER